MAGNGLEFCIENHRIFVWIGVFLQWLGGLSGDSFYKAQREDSQCFLLYTYVIACDWKRHRFWRVKLIGHLDVFLTCHHSKSLLNHHFFVE